ncbi:MAG TPA: hypothetical protein VMD51_11040, partial [Mycobacterium sp.]|nr:hypothetical protein [Mycobacterium sp.]
MAFEDVEGGQFGGLLDPQTAGEQQLQQRPVPEGVAFGAGESWLVGGGGELLRCFVPAAQGERTDVGDLTVEVHHGGGHPCGGAGARGGEALPVEVVAGQRDRDRHVSGQRGFRLRAPGAQVGEERPHVDHPVIGGGAVLGALGGGAALHRPGGGQRPRYEPARVLRKDLPACTDVGVLLDQVGPEVGKRPDFRANRAVVAADPLRIHGHVERGHRPELRWDASIDEFLDRLWRARLVSCRAPPR